MSPDPNQPCLVCCAPTRQHLSIGQHRLLRCSACFTSFCFPQPSDQELSDFYSAFHLPDNVGGVYDSVESRMQADFPSKIRLVKQYDPNPRLLDVGCGKGFFVKACIEQALDAEGIDLSLTAVEFARNKLRVTAHQGLIENSTTLREGYSSITMWATIEHLPDPRKTLEAIASRLLPNGFLHFDTGVGWDWLDRMLPGNVQWYDPPQHLFVFSHRGLEILLEQAGFEIVRYDGCFERSLSRRIARIVRGFIFSASLRLVVKACGMNTSMKSMTRFPLGNLQSITAKKKERRMYRE